MRNEIRTFYKFSRHTAPQQRSSSLCFSFWRPSSHISNPFSSSHETSHINWVIKWISFTLFFFTLSAVIFSYEKISQLAANLTAQSYTLSRAYYLKYCSHHHQPHRVRRPLLCFLAWVMMISSHNCTRLSLMKCSNLPLTIVPSIAKSLASDTSDYLR